VAVEHLADSPQMLQNDVIRLCHPKPYSAATGCSWYCA
jgi:hypothetical protein